MRSEFHGDRRSVLEDEKVLDMDGGDGHTTLSMYLMQQNCTLKMVKVVNFILSIFYHSFKKCIFMS